MQKHISIGEVASLLGVSVVTLRRWERLGKLLPDFRTEGNHRRYLLETQAQRLTQHAKDCNLSNFICIKDLGSGLNYKKKGLQQLLKLLLTRQVSHLIVTYKDRLLRFGSELLFTICQHYHIKVTILERSATITKEQQLCADVTELMTVFSSRLYGSRSHKNKQAA